MSVATLEDRVERLEKAVVSLQKQILEGGDSPAHSSNASGPDMPVVSSDPTPPAAPANAPVSSDLTPGPFDTPPITTDNKIRLNPKAAPVEQRHIREMRRDICSFLANKRNWSRCVMLHIDRLLSVFERDSNVRAVVEAIERVAGPTSYLQISLNSLRAQLATAEAIIKQAANDSLELRDDLLKQLADKEAALSEARKDGEKLREVVNDAANAIDALLVLAHQFVAQPMQREVAVLKRVRAAMRAEGTK